MPSVESVKRTANNWKDKAKQTGESMAMALKPLIGKKKSKKMKPPRKLIAFDVHAANMCNERVKDATEITNESQDQVETYKKETGVLVEEAKQAVTDSNTTIHEEHKRNTTYKDNVQRERDDNMEQYHKEVDRLQRELNDKDKKLDRNIEDNCNRHNKRVERFELARNDSVKQLEKLVTDRNAGLLLALEYKKQAALQQMQNLAANMTMTGVITNGIDEQIRLLQPLATVIQLMDIDTPAAAAISSVCNGAAAGSAATRTLSRVQLFH
jgi:hypothetical protein